MAYNRWLSSQYSYSSGSDLMHYGRKGMRWGKHIFGLPEITLNGGGGSAVDLEELKKLLEQGKITLDEFKARAEKHFQSVADVNKDGLKQVQDKFADYMKKVSDTYENFKAGDSADKKPDRREYLPWSVAGVDKSKKYDNTDDYDAKKRGDYWIRSSDGSRHTDWELDKEYEKNKKASQEEKRSAADRARVNSKLQQRDQAKAEDEFLRKLRVMQTLRLRQQVAYDPENELGRQLSALRSEREYQKKVARKKESKRKNEEAIMRKVETNSSLLNGQSSSKGTPKQNTPSKSANSSSSTEKLVGTALSSMSKADKTKPKKEEYDVTAKQRKIYQTIGKFLNFTMNFKPAYRVTKRITKR